MNTDAIFSRGVERNKKKLVKPKFLASISKPFLAATFLGGNIFGRNWLHLINSAVCEDIKSDVSVDGNGKGNKAYIVSTRAYIKTTNTEKFDIERKLNLGSFKENIIEASIYFNDDFEPTGFLLNGKDCDSVEEFNSDLMERLQHGFINTHHGKGDKIAIMGIVNQAANKAGFNIEFRP